MVDPSLFSIPYDTCLCEALVARGHHVELHGRPPRPGDVAVGRGCGHVADFYAVSERIRAAPLPRAERLARVAKVPEHGVDLVRLSRRLRRRPPDVVHVQWLVVPSLDAVALPRLRRVAPLVLTVHNSVPAHASARSAVQTAGWDRALVAADHLVVHTGSGRDALVDRGIDAGRVSVIPHGLLPSGGPGGPSGPDGVDGAPGPAADGTVEVLQFGRIRAYKGIDVLLRAVGALPAPARDRVRVRIVGAPDMPIDGLRALAGELRIADRVEWDLRFVPDGEVGAIFDRADIVAFPYRDVDASGVMMKALAHGRPVVASNVGGFPELLEGSAELVAVDDHEALAAALGRLVEDPSWRDELGARARRLSGDVPGWDEIAARTVEVYDRARERWAAQR